VFAALRPASWSTDVAAPPPFVGALRCPCWLSALLLRPLVEPGVDALVYLPALFGDSRVLSTWLLSPAAVAPVVAARRLPCLVVRESGYCLRVCRKRLRRRYRCRCCGCGVAVRQRRGYRAWRLGLEMVDGLVSVYVNTRVFGRVV